ncbi:hypothetical protein BDW59DRAFT_140899 [Aspergillus cavernicola]|uniref:Zn(2)-C6 fungal-type domain-containing protein n=1 Tax=Aspergillus cavernicola TaxID=176166 RepID=A0ABR4ISW7_9EURO
MNSALDSHAFSPSDSDGATLSITPLAVARMSAASDADRESDVSIKKRKRVRTGCFTCRDRHLKCDEALGQCQNCRKSGRPCRRGVRLNFVDTQVVAPPTYITPPTGSSVTFQDDSRTIASEYVDGFERYPPPEQEPLLEDRSQIPAPVHPYSSDPSAMPLFKSAEHNSSRHLSFSNYTELSLVQVFVEKVAPWMDVVDDMEHFTRILPFHALEEPMLYTAFAACAGCHISIGLPETNESMHYSTAVQMLSEYLSDSHHDPALCAIAAVIIEVAEAVALGPVESAKRIQPATPARSLIRECQWNTRTQGLGGACSWLNIVMELLDCLINPERTLTWDPDTWGIDINFTQAQLFTGNEELWTQRMIYICAKVLDFRASNQLGLAGHSAINQRLHDWNLYNEWCDRWLISIPRSMLPLGQLQPWQRSPQSVFPQVWLPERSAIVAQMLYHVTQIILIKTDPLHDCLPEMQHEQQRHAYNVCGITSSDRRSGIPIFSTQLILVAAEFLIEPEAREEVLAILDQMGHTTGLKTQQVKEKLLDTWGRGSSHGHQPPHNSLVPGIVSNEFHTSNPDHDYLTDPFTDSFTESHPYLDHLTYHQL